jgi:hypothetical protein
MKVLRYIAMHRRCAGCGARHGLARLLRQGRDALLALWAIGVLAFCALGFAGAML